MRIISFIEDSSVIRDILTHLGLWLVRARPPQKDHTPPVREYAAGDLQLQTHRPYRPGLGIDAALNEIEQNRGVFYDEAVVDACLRLFRDKGFKIEDNSGFARGGLL